jgi:hypothetical protein
MKRVILGFLTCLPLAACGVGETAISAAAGGASACGHEPDKRHARQSLFPTD